MTYLTATKTCGYTTLQNNGFQKLRQQITEQ